MHPGTPFPSLNSQIGVDLETTGLSLADPEVWICGVGIGDVNGQYYFPLRHHSDLGTTTPTENYEGEERSKLLFWLRTLFLDPTRQVLFHNASFDLGFLRKEFGATNWDFFQCTIEDSMLLATLLNENRSVSLEQLTRNVLLIRPEQKEKFQGFYKFATLPANEVSDYCCEDVWLTLNLFNKLHVDPEYGKLESVYRRELEFSFTLAQLELQGCPFSASERDRIQNLLHPKWENLLEEIYTKFPSSIPKEDFLRAPSRLTAEYLKIAPPSLSENSNSDHSDLLALWHLLEHYEQVYRMLELFPKTCAPTVSPRYLLTKAEGRPFSQLQQLSKNPLSFEWGLQKLITAFPNKRFYELSLEELSPRLALAHSQDSFYYTLLEAPQISIFQFLAQKLNLSFQQTQSIANLFFSGQPISSVSPAVISEFETLFPRWIQFQIHLKDQLKQEGYLCSCLGRRRRLAEKYEGHATQTFLNLTKSELIKSFLRVFSEYVALQFEDKILLQLPRSVPIQSLLKKIPNPFRLGEIRIPLKIQINSGKNWHELSFL